MAKKDLCRNGTAYKILEYAFFAGSFTVKQANLSIGKAVAASVVNNGIKELYERHYIERLFPNGKKDGHDPDGWRSGNKSKAYFTITDSGICHLGKNCEYHKAVARFAKKETSLSKAQENEDRLNAYAFARGAGFNTFTVQKPSFENLVWLLNENMDEPLSYPDEYPLIGEDLLGEYLKDGIYYTAAEIRAGMEALGIDRDTFITTRITGLLITGQAFYLIYSFDAKGYMVLLKDMERALTDTLCRILKKYNRPAAIMLTKTFAPAASICVGHKNGRDRFEEERTRSMELIIKSIPVSERDNLLITEEARRRRNKGYAISSRLGSKILTGETTLFPELYVVPVTPACTPLLLRITNTSRKAQVQESLDWFNSHEGFSEGLSREDIVNGSYKNGSVFFNAVYLPVIDCKVLTKIREHRKDKLAIVTDPKMAAIISQILGSRAGMFFDLAGKEIPGVPGFKDTGYPVGRDKYQALAEKNRSLRELSRQKSRIPKESISIRTNASIKEKIRKLAKERGMTVSEIGGLLLEYAVESLEDSPGPIAEDSRKTE